MFQFFHWYYPGEKKLWNHLVEEAPHLAAMGISAVWLPPAYKASEGPSSAGYDVYDVYDLGEFNQRGSVETKYGTKDQYLEAIKTLHENGIQAYADIILNHKAGADEAEDVMAFKVNPEDRNEPISKPNKIKAFTKFYFPGRAGKYSDFIWDFRCFTGVDWDDERKEHGIFKIVNEYGEDWEPMLGDEKGNFDYLMFSDIEFRNPAVKDELLRWGKWYIDQTGIDGFRLDAAKHMSSSFFAEWLGGLREHAQAELFAVGEYAGPLNLMQEFLMATQGSLSLFDFPLHDKFTTISKTPEEHDIRQIFEDTLTGVDPTHSVTFVDNHDTQALREFESDTKDWFRPHAYALILLRQEGYPCIFFPDIYGARYKDDRPDHHETEYEISPCAELPELLRIRKDYSYGMQRDFFLSPSLIGWTREGLDEKVGSGCAVLINTGETGYLDMEMGDRNKGRTLYDLVGGVGEKVVLDDKGNGRFTVNSRGVSVWVFE